jgi:hypothetical protein
MTRRGRYQHYMRGKLNRRNVRQFRALITFRQYGRASSRHCERSEAIQTATAERFWIASLRSQ